MDLDERAVKIFKEAEALSETDLRGALVRMREALAIEPDYPNLEDEIFIREDAITKLDGVLEFIVVLLREGKDFQACEMLRSFPDNYIIQDISGLVGGLEEKIGQVESLVNQAKELAQSDCVKALSIYEKAFKLVSDYPGLAGEVSTLKQDVAQYTSYVSSIDKALKGRNAAQATKLFGDFREVFPDDEHVGRFKAAIVNLSKELKKKKRRKINLLMVIGSVGAVLVVAVAYFAFEMNTIRKAGQQWEDVNHLLAAQKFSETQAACREINTKLDLVRFFFVIRKQELQDKVDDVLQSEVVVKGAEGKVLFDGGYIPKEYLAISKEIKHNIEEAKSFAEAGNYATAIRAYENILLAAAGLDSKTSAEVIDNIKLSITNCRLNIIRDLAARAGALMATGSLDAALAGINEAIALVTENSIDVNEPVVVIVFGVQQEIRRAKLKELLGIGDKLFVIGSYDSVIKAYKQAHDFARANKLDSVSLRRQIDKMINKSEVRGVMVSGDRYLASGKWQRAAKAYEKGLALAMKFDLQNTASFQVAQSNIEKAKKMHVVTVLARQNKLGSQHFKANELQKAIDVFRPAIKSGMASEWRNDKDVAAILVKLKSGLAEAKEKIFVDSKKKFLIDRSAAILKKDFELGADATLLDAEVIFLTATPEVLTFSISAMSYTKSGSSGKYSRYEAVYAFDRRRGNWGLVNKVHDSKVSEEIGY